MLYRLPARHRCLEKLPRLFFAGKRPPGNDYGFTSSDKQIDMAPALGNLDKRFPGIEFIANRRNVMQTIAVNTHDAFEKSETRAWISLQ
jgi:hypothetical protein